MRLPTSSRRTRPWLLAGILAAVLGALPLAPAAGAAAPCAGCPWSGWQPLSFDYSGYPLGATLMAATPGGRIEGVVRLVDGGWGLSSQVEPNGTAWTPVTRIADPAPVHLASGYQLRERTTASFRDARGRIRLYDHQVSSFTFDLDRRVSVNVQTDTGWTGWLPTPHSFLPTASALAADGRLEVFGYNDDDYPIGLHHAWELPGTGGWGERVAVSTLRDSFAVGANADGRLQLFVADGAAVWSSWQTSLNGGWSAAAPLATGNLWVQGLVQDLDGRLELFASSTDGLFNAWQHTPDGTWSAPARFGPDPGVNRLAVARGRDGRVEAFLRETTYQRLYTRWQYAPGGAFSPWTAMPGNEGVPVVVTDGAGHLVLFDGSLWNIQQT